ncbi:MAG: RluA family pseudouridine synthase [Ruminococcaceae bacterium]|nr:RluA family pseudouridine synthase [Oscillospiraceae bacterium]
MIDLTDVGKRLDVYVAEREGITRSAAAKLTENGQVTVNGNTVSKNYRLREGDTVETVIPAPIPDKALPEAMPLDIVYEDKHLLVVNKPKGMVVHPAAGNPSGTLVNALLYHCGESLSGINGVIRPGIVHRIDKDTSGLLVVAKTDEAHLSLAEQIASHRFERQYRALVNGHLKEDSGRIDRPIGRHPVDRKKMAIVKDGRPAATNYHVLASLEHADYLALQLETGRTHQIRVHLSSLGHPLLGDTVYGGGRTKFEQSHESLLCGQCLHAKTISFAHPQTGDIMRFDSPLPDYFAELLRLLGGTSLEETI